MNKNAITKHKLINKQYTVLYYLTACLLSYASQVNRCPLVWATQYYDSL